MKIKQIEQILINTVMFKITWNKKSYGGSFSYEKNIIEIGTKDPSDIYIFGILLHELTEIVCLEHGIRYRKPQCTEDYLFVADHTQFTAVTNMVAGLLSQFLD